MRASELLKQPLRDAPRWLFLATLIYAPWAYGCTTAVTIGILNWLLATMIVLWAADIAYRRSWPSVSWPLVVIISLILLFGWAMTFNAHSIYDPELGVFAPTKSRWPNGPGTFDAILSFALMTRATLLLVCLIIVADLARRPVWLLRIWSTIGIAGASIAFLGLLQKGLGAPMILWGSSAGLGKDFHTFFATFFYHGNAGAFLNLILPLTLGLALRTMTGRTEPIQRALWIAAAVLVLVAVMANTSRVSQLLGVFLVIVVTARPAWQALRSGDRGEKWQVGTGILVVAIALIAVAQASKLHHPLQRWQQFTGQFSADARWTSAKTAISALPEAGWFGFGPGTFRTVFPYYSRAGEGEVTAIWRFLHQDYLQFLLEWGAIGSVFFGALFFGGMAVAFRAVRRAYSSWLPRQRTLIPLVLLALASVALHALVDFPLQIASIQLYVVTYLGICWGSSAWKRS